MFSWTAGEHAVAGRSTIGGTMFDWHGNACSGQLEQQFAYSGPADLEPVTMGVADAVDPAYYSGLQHDRTIESSSSMLVSGHQAWMVTFLMTYPDAASEGLAWTSEAGAVVVVDRGAGQAPAVFYASVPSNLGTRTSAPWSARSVSALADGDVAATAVDGDRVGGVRGGQRAAG